MIIPENIHTILRRIGEKVFPEIINQRNQISCYKAGKSVILSYNDPALMKSKEAKNRLSISFGEMEKYEGTTEEYLSIRVKLFKELDGFLRKIVPEIQSITEDTDSIGITFNKNSSSGNEYLRFYYEKTLFNDFNENPEETKDSFLKELQKKEENIKRVV